MCLANRLRWHVTLILWVHSRRLFCNQGVVGVEEDTSGRLQATHRCPDWYCDQILEPRANMRHFLTRFIPQEMTHSPIAGVLTVADPVKPTTASLPPSRRESVI